MHPTDTIRFDIEDIEDIEGDNSDLRFVVTTSITHNGGDNFTLDAVADIIDISDDASILDEPLVASVTGNRNNSSYDPLTMENTFELGLVEIGVDNQAGEGEFGGAISFDNYTLTGTPIPEPTALAGAALLGLATLRRRR